MKFTEYSKSINLKDHSGFDCQKKVSYSVDLHELYWKRNDQYHRLDGPAVHRDGTAVRNGKNRIVDHDYWYYECLYHRLDGPADDGYIFVDYWIGGWYIYGVEVTEIYEEYV